MKKAKKPDAAPSTQTVEAGTVHIEVSGEKRNFDINDPKLPGWIKDKALTSGGYPYQEKLGEGPYGKALELLQMELVKLQAWLQKTGERVLVVFEGRDAAGKGGTIDAVRQYMNPRQARNVALPKPSETERGQWYYQRYVAQFPTSGEFVTFDRSWYNRAGVEPVMGFCTAEQHRKFLAETPHFERMIVDDGIRLFKFWLNLGQEMQLKRFHDRRHSPLTIWKFSPMDVAGMTKWQDYTEVDVVTQNIDGLHQAAGSRTVLELHGTNRAAVCLACGEQEPIDPVLARLEANLLVRQEIWRAYDAAFAGMDGVITPQVHDHGQTRHARHLYTLRIEAEEFGCDRMQFIRALSAENIGSGIHFVPLHLHRWHREHHGTSRGDFPVAEAIGDTTVSLPLSAAMNAEDTKDVIDAVKKIAAHYRSNPVAVPGWRVAEHREAA